MAGSKTDYLENNDGRSTPSQTVVDGRKLCSACGESKPLEAFYANKRRSSGRDGCCRECRNAYPSQHGERKREVSRRWYERNKIAQRVRRYGITAEQYAEMVARQKGRCALCGGPPCDRGLVVDHDHESGVVRALLCLGCNSGLGLFREDCEVLGLAIDYLRRHG